VAKCKTTLLLGWLSTGSDQARPRAALDSVLPFELCWRRWFCQLQSADKFRQTLDRFPNKTFHALRQPIASTEIPIASDARPLHTSRGFLPWRFAYAGPVCAAPPSWGRHPKTFTNSQVGGSCREVRFTLNSRRRQPGLSGPKSANNGLGVSLMYHPPCRKAFQAREVATRNDTEQKAIVPQIRTSGCGSLSHTSAARQRHAGIAQACVPIYCRRNASGARVLQMNSSTSNLREIVSTGCWGCDLASSAMTDWKPHPATPMNAMASRHKRSDISLP
jgi:hypothetical protein